MGLEHRPYIGSWRLGAQKVIQVTPDALLYINGDLALPGCPRCNGKIDIQQFLTEVSVDAGTDAGASSASFTLSIPVHYNESFVRDAQTILRPGLEVHVYERGYFPVRGLYSNLDQPRMKGVFATSGEERKLESPSSVEVFRDAERPVPDENGGLTREQIQAWARNLGVSEDILLTSIVLNSESGVPAEREYITHSIFNHAARRNKSVWKVVVGGQATTTGKQGAQGRPYSTYRLPTDAALKVAVGQATTAVRKRRDTGETGSGVVTFFHTQAQKYNHKKNPASNMAVDDLQDRWVSRGLVYLDKLGFDPERVRFFGYKTPLGESPVWEQATAALIPEGGSPSQQAQASAEVTPPPEVEVRTPGESSFPTLSDMGMSGMGIEDILAYPYYLTFHGVITQVSVAYSAGVQTVTAQCSSMLHFWQYQRISTNASLFGARPTNSKNRVSMVGHNFTGMHPYEVMYTLHNDVAGAAAGVSWALSRKTNVDATSAVTNESLFSLNLRYWEQRFQTRQIRLRMHGADGRLYNAAQAAFLGSTDSKQLTRLLKDRFSKNPNGVGKDAAVLQGSIFTGLFDQRRLESLLMSQAGISSRNAKFEINVAEMVAFVLNLGNVGNLNFFESTYESKLDIAQQVCEVTGFEFYQDVDGDFVFKPPFYNLDTSSSRIYCIEDIDIISMTFNEQEPQATYITGKNAQYSNLQGTGLENEWGVQGTYIDYRLVAQFGWRPADFETSYLNDSKAVFFAAANRLDIVNIGMHSGNITIPLRPELRPGYPVYIRSMDCFYYCSSFAHSFSVGGQCTTSLEISGRRAKFYAPGDPNARGIEAIDLGNTRLPQRPLEILDDAGVPRLAGFPNVVMALDPNQLNPLYFLVGEDIDSITSDEALNSLLKMAVDFRILNQDPANPGIYTWAEGPHQDTTLYFTPHKVYGGSGGGRQPGGSVDLRKAARGYTTAFDALGSNTQSRENAVAKLSRELAPLQSQQAGLDPAVPRQKKRFDALQRRINKIQAKIDKKFVEDQKDRDKFDTKLNSGEKSAVAMVHNLIRTVGAAFLGRQTDRGDPFGDVNSTANLLEMLSDKKAIFTNGSLPGTYRYYSASHPDPNQQGQMDFSLDMRKYLKEQAVKKGGNPYIEPRYADTQILTFASAEKKTFPAGAAEPEAQLILDVPVTGIRVFTNNPSAPDGEVLPTSEIMDLMFARHTVTSNRPKDQTKYLPDVWEEGTTVAQWVSSAEAEVARNETQWKTASIRKMLGGIWYAERLVEVKEAVREARTEVGTLGSQVPDFPFPELPPEVNARGTSLGLDVPFGDGSYRLADVGSPASPELYPGSSKATLERVWGNIAAQVGTRATLRMFAAAREVWKKSLDSVFVGNPGVADKVFSAFYSYFSGGNVKDMKKARVKVTKARSISTPVFPVSDAKGYEVIGSFRYGRGLDIDPDGVFDVLHRQDPLQMLDKKTVDDIVRVLVKGKGIWTRGPQTGTSPSGAPIYGKAQFVGGALAVKEVEQRLLSQLRNKLTDQQILDLGLAVRTGDPNVLQINLSNWFAEKGRDGVQKIPLVNAAYSLADISGSAAQHVCSCKAAEADVLLEAAGQDGFVQYVEPGILAPQGAVDDTQDRPTQWSIALAAQASVRWKMSQDALRGTTKEMGRSSIVGSALAFKDLEDRVAANAAATQSQLRQETRRIQDQGTALREREFTREET